MQDPLRQPPWYAGGLPRVPPAQARPPRGLGVELRGPLVEALTRLDKPLLVAAYQPIVLWGPWIRLAAAYPWVHTLLVAADAAALPPVQHHEPHGLGQFGLEEPHDPFGVPRELPPRPEERAHLSPFQLLTYEVPRLGWIVEGHSVRDGRAAASRGCLS